jgi:diguanylate cyclase (GGDEF)-like protein
MQNATDPEILAALNRHVTALDKYQNADWYRQTTAIRLPRLTDFMTLRRAEAILGDENRTGTYGRPRLPQKVYDDKFGILSPPSSVGPDLEYWRDECDLRGIGFALAYFDIDNFKRDFNERYSETMVDHNCLPVIMRKIESHAFYHGIAYHEGGDEFIFLLPNADEAYTVEFLDKLRIDMPTITFQGVDSKATVSIGICCVPPDSPLTDTEIRMKANAAKKFAKREGSKNCIVVSDGNEWTQGGFRLVRPEGRQARVEGRGAT